MSGRDISLRVLVVGVPSEATRGLAEAFQEAGFEPSFIWRTPEEGLSDAGNFELIISTERVSVLGDLAQRAPLLVLGPPALEVALECIRAGATDYLPLETLSGAQVGSAITASLRRLRLRETAQKNAEERLRRLVRVARGVAFELDEEGRCLDLWVGDESLLARSKEQMIGHTLLEVLGESTGGALLEGLRRVLATGKAESLEYEGEGRRWFTAELALGLDRHTVSLFVRNTTKQKRAEEALKESETRYRVVSELSSDYAYSQRPTPDGPTELEWITSAFARITGYEPSEVRTLAQWRTLIHPEDLPAVLERQKKLLFGPPSAEPYLHEYRIVTRRGEIRWLRILARALRDADGRVFRIYGAAKDITEQKHAEEALRRRVDQQAAVARLGQRALAGVDPDALFDEAVTLAARVLGVPMCEILEVLPSEDTLLLRAGVGWEPGRVGQERFSDGESLAGYTLRVGEPVLVLDLSSETRFYTPRLTGRGVKSSVSVLIQNDARSYGILQAHSLKPHNFSQDDVYFLGAVANVLSDAIARSLVETARLQKQARLKLLNDISTGVLLEVSVNDVIERVLKQIFAAFPGLRIAYSVIDERGWLQVLDSLEPPGMHSLRGVEADLSSAPGYLHALKQREVVLVPDVSRDARLAPLAQALAAGQTSALLDVPLHHSGGLVGLLCFDAPQPRRFSEHEVSTLQEVAEYLSIALKNAHEQEERRRTSEALQESESRFRQLTENILQAFWITDLENHQMLYVSSGYEKIWGRSRESLYETPTSWFDDIHEDDREQVREALAYQAEGRYDVRYRVVCPDGEVRWIHARAFPVRDASGAVYRIAGIADDITERKQAEDDLQRWADEWRLTFDAIELAILVFDRQGRLLRLNRFAQALTSTRREELVGGTIEALGTRELWQQIAPLLQCVLAGGDGISTRLYETANGAHWSVSLGLSEGRERIIVFARDITSVIALEASVRRSETMATMGALVAGVAHEVRNPLFGISATIDAFEERFGTANEQQPYLKILRGELDRLNALMRDLLEYGRPYRLELSQGDFRDVATPVFERSRSLAERSRVTLEMSLSPDLARVLMDPLKLGQVVKNLLENAIQHSPAQGTLSLEASMVEVEGRRYLEFQVNDCGPGFRPEDIPRVFEPFFTRRKGGTGLGLSIVHRIVEEHLGRVFVSNLPGGGGRVTVRLPASK